MRGLNTQVEKALIDVLKKIASELEKIRKAKELELGLMAIAFDDDESEVK